MNQKGIWPKGYKNLVKHAFASKAEARQLKHYQNKRLDYRTETVSTHPFLAKKKAEFASGLMKAGFESNDVMRLLNRGLYELEMRIAIQQLLIDNHTIPPTSETIPKMILESSISSSYFIYYILSILYIIYIDKIEKNNPDWEEKFYNPERSHRPKFCYKIPDLVGKNFKVTEEHKNKCKICYHNIANIVTIILL